MSKTHIIVALRSATADEFWCEAYGIRPCQVRVKQLGSEDIARILYKIRNAKSQPTKSARVPCSHKPIDEIFKPPVPVPAECVEVHEMSHAGKYAQTLFEVLSISSLKTSVLIRCIFLLIFSTYGIHTHPQRAQLCTPMTIPGHFDQDDVLTNDSRFYYFSCFLV